jgi:hypothetical protein
LDGVVQLGNLAQHVLRCVLVDEIASGQQEQRAETASAREKPSSGRLRHQLRGVANEQLVVDARDLEFSLQGQPP